MQPYLYGIVLTLLAIPAMFAGALAGHWIYDAWAKVGLGIWSFPFLYLGSALAGLLSAVYVVDRFVIIRCPQCGERMTKKGVRRSFLFTCPSYGRSQYG